MGRKIPAKKHRGVKDPLVQQARRAASLKGKINAPPRDPDEQPVPKSLLRLFGAAKSAEDKKKRFKGKQQGTEKSRKAVDGAGGGNPVAKLKRLPGESARAFSQRITGAARALHDATEGQHYPVEEEEEQQPAWAARREARVAERGERETRAQRRRAKLKQRKAELAQSIAATASVAARELVYERVPFGERADAPPALPAPRLPAALRAGAPAKSRPGRRDLLLSRLLPGGAGPAAGGGDTAAARRQEAAERRRMDAVTAYRALKAARRHKDKPLVCVR